MSWGIFKSSLLISMQTNAFGSDITGFAKNFTNLYDITIKTGGDTINKIPLSKGNKELMESTLITLLNQTQYSKTTTLLEIIGPAIIAYWTGANLSIIPPIVPAVGALYNIATITAPVLSGGVWTPLMALPNNNPAIFIDAFIQSAKIHLSTVNGIFTVIAQYPPLAPPAPGIVNWVGYMVTD